MGRDSRSESRAEDRTEDESSGPRPDSFYEDGMSVSMLFMSDC